MCRGRRGERGDRIALSAEGGNAVVFYMWPSSLPRISSTVCCVMCPGRRGERGIESR